MRRVAVVGGGISGLSTCFYLTRFRPGWDVTLYEPGRLGGWLQTVQKDGFTFETGPRSIRVSDKTAAILDIAEELGVIDQVVFAKTTNKDVEIFADGKLFRLFPKPPFSRLKFLLSNPVHMRTALSTIPFMFKKRLVKQTDDQSIEELIQTLMGFRSAEDAQYIIHTYADAMVQGIYSGDLTKLSARSCQPFSAIFAKRNLPDYKPQAVKSKGVKAKEVLATGMGSNSNAMNFKGGLSTFVAALAEDLVKRGVDIRTEAVKEIRKVSDSAGKVVCEKSEAEYDTVISTVSSNLLSTMLPDFPEIAQAAAQVKHNSLLALNIGFAEAPKVEGVGYLVPSREKSIVSGVLYDFCQFPHLKPCISAMVPCETRPQLSAILPQVLEKIKQQTGISASPVAINENFTEKALPQYEVGHYKLIETVQRHQPSWLHISGHSLYPSGIPNCVLTAHDVVSTVMALDSPS